MSQFPDLEVLKEIPGYQAILKAVLKSQIQLLVEQLSLQTGEESVILTASVTDGTLCHLGSESGKVFLTDHEDIKSQFLGFCLKRHHKRKEPPSPHSNQSSQNSDSASKRFRNSDSYSPSPATPVHPVSLQHITPGRNIAGQRRPPQQSHMDTRLPSTSQSQPSAYLNEQNFQPTYTNNSVGVSNMKEERDHNGSGSNQSGAGNSIRGPADSEQLSGDSDQSEQTSMIVKTEPGDEELEITGVELSNMSESGQMGFNRGQWPQNLSSDGLGYGPSTTGAEGNSFDAGDQSDYANKVPDLNGSSLVEELDNVTSYGMKYQCRFCQKVFRQKCDITRHVRTHTGEKPFQCDLCGRKFAVKSNMTAHRYTHLLLSMQCYVPQVDFSSANHYPTTTARQGHDQTTATTNLSMSNIDLRSLVRHKCEICNKIFGQKNDLTRHVRRHTGEKPFVCDICQKGFVVNSVLKNHRRKIHLVE